MKIKKITIQTIGTALPSDFQQYCLLSLDSMCNEEECLAKLTLDLWKQGFECHQTCEGSNEGEFIILVNSIPDGECG